MSDLEEALLDSTQRVFVQVAMDEHPCCYDVATTPDVVATLLGPITDAVRAAANHTRHDQKEG